jgi:hypothetical protein
VQGARVEQGLAMPINHPNLCTGVAKAHRWIDTGIVKTRLGNFEFRGGYPTEEAARKLHEAHLIGRAIDVYFTQMPAVSSFNIWKTVAAVGHGSDNQLVIWEELMNAHTLLLSGNFETVHAMASLDLRRDGPVIVHVPATIHGGIWDMWQRPVAAIGPTGIDNGGGGRLLLLPPGCELAPPADCIPIQCPSFRVSVGFRGFLRYARASHAVSLMRALRIYPLSRAGRPRPMTFVNASGPEMDTVFCDTECFFDDLAELVEYEPRDALPPHERFSLATIGIEKGSPYSPDAARRRLLREAAHAGSALARRNSFVSTDPARLVYEDRRWEWAFVGNCATWDSQGYLNTDRRAALAYAGVGMFCNESQCLWATRDAAGAHLDGSRTYRLVLPANIPASDFWSVVVYDAVSRSMLRTPQKFPTVSAYTSPDEDEDGSIGILIGPRPLRRQRNWIQTIPGRGWFAQLRLYGARYPFFEQTWKPGDITVFR